MKVIVLESGAKERTLIQDAVDKSHNEMILAETPADVVSLIKSGKGRFVVADESAAAGQMSDFVQSLRAANLPSIYILTLTSGEKGSADSDDTLPKPFTVTELAARIMIGQRFLSLGDSLSQARDQIENMALYDVLTGLMNRSAFYRTAQGELERARRASTSLSVIALDLDNFKSLTDTHGMQTGDEVLKVVAQTIREKSRPYDCIGRWTGDEFVIALPGVIGEDAEKIAERIIKGIRSTQITFGNTSLNVAISAGIAAVLRISASTEVEPLIEQARQAMLRARESGGNQVNLTYV